MITRSHNGLEWLEFELLADCPIIHGCLTRKGGISQNSYGGLNLSYNVKDNSDHVTDNWNKFKEAFPIEKYFLAKLNHGKTVTQIQVTTSIHEIPISDGISTRQKNIALITTQADCQAAIFYDPINHAFTNVHCGWRGNVQNIYAETIIHMQKTYQSKPENLLVCISPSLGPQNSQFIHYQQELPKEFWQFQQTPLFFDFWAISQWQLTQAGILPHHIQIAKIDTFSNGDYFSFRRAKECGRQATFCALK